jgi:hypothetical protein
MDNLFDRIKSVGFHGAVGLIVILALVFLVVYGFVERPDHKITSDAVAILGVGAGSVITAVVMALKGKSE